MNKRQLTKGLREAGLEKEELKGLSREEMEALYWLYVMASMLDVIARVNRIAPVLSHMTDILQGKGESSDE